MTREPAACASMAELRAEIDRLDRELVALLARRAGYIDRAVAVKRARRACRRASRRGWTR